MKECDKPEKVVEKHPIKRKTFCRLLSKQQLSSLPPFAGRLFGVLQARSRQRPQPVHEDSTLRRRRCGPRRAHHPGSTQGSELRPHGLPCLAVKIHISNEDGCHHTRLKTPRNLTSPGSRPPHPHHAGVVTSATQPHWGCDLCILNFAHIELPTHVTDVLPAAPEDCIVAPPAGASLTT